jgi:hypothetical protein
VYEQIRRVYGRVSYLWPGKHGDGDIRVEFCGKAPSHAEFLTIAWGLARSEDRYSAEHECGRWWLKQLLDEIWKAGTWTEAKPIIERAQKSVDEKRAA